MFDAFIDSYDIAKQKYKCRAVFLRDPAPADPSPGGEPDYLLTNVEEYDLDRGVTDPVYFYAVNYYELMPQGTTLVHRGGAIPPGTYVKVGVDHNWEYFFDLHMDPQVEITGSTEIPSFTDRRWSYQWKLVYPDPVNVGKFINGPAITHNSNGWDLAYNSNESNNAVGAVTVGMGADFSAAPLTGTTTQLLRPVRGNPVTTMKRRMALTAGAPPTYTPKYWIDLPNMVQGPCS